MTTHMLKIKMLQAAIIAKIEKNGMVASNTWENSSIRKNIFSNFAS